MKILVTNSFIKIAQDYQTGPSVKRPDDQRGSEKILEKTDEDNESINSIKKKWRKKQIQKTDVFLPYQKS